MTTHQAPTGAASEASPVQNTEKLTGAALGFLFLLLIFRLWYAGTHGIIGDEAHYWLWSRHFAPGYYDQGPGIALFIRAGTSIFGHNPFGIRFVPVLLSVLTGWLGFVTVRAWLGARVALVSLVTLSVAPLLAVGGMLATYDNPMVLWWTSGLCALTWTLQTERRAGWYLVGACVGGGLLCKLTMILFAPCVLLSLLLVPRFRRHLATPHPYLAFLLALVIASPLIYWNATHEWPNVQHAAALSSRNNNAKPFKYFGEFLGGQALVVGPVLFLAQFWIFTVIANRYRRGKASDGEVLLWAFSAPILLICLYISLKSRVEANWPAPMYVAALPLVCAAFVAGWDARKMVSRILAPLSVGLSALMVGFLLFPEIAPLLGITLNAVNAQKANETYGWELVSDGITRARRQIEQEGKPYFMAGVNYRAPAVVALIQPDHPPTTQLFLETRRNQFIFWGPPQEQLIGQNALMFWDDNRPEQWELLSGCFESVEMLPPVVVNRPGFDAPVKTWRIFLCRNFRGYDLKTNLQGW